MLRTLALALAIGLPGVAAAEQFPQSAINAEVRGDDGTELGRVTAVERNAEGEIVAAEIPGLEPGDAPYAPDNLIAENDRELVVPASVREQHRERIVGAQRVSLR